MKNCLFYQQQAQTLCGEQPRVLATTSLVTRGTGDRSFCWQHRATATHTHINNIREGEVDEDASVTCVAPSLSSPDTSEHSPLSSFHQFREPLFWRRSTEAVVVWGILYKRFRRGVKNTHKNSLIVFRINSINSLHRDRRGKRAPPLTLTSSTCDLGNEVSCNWSLQICWGGGGEQISFSKID